jgi:hypothetical protein
MNYTVVGYFENSGQPWVEHVAHVLLDQAVDKAVRQLEEKSGGAYELVVLSVLEGQHLDLRAGSGPLYVGDAEQFEDLFEEDPCASGEE